MRQLRINAVLGLALLVFSGPAIAANPAADLNKVLNDYRAAEQKLPRDADLKFAEDGSKIYNPNGALASVAAQRQINQDTRARLEQINSSDLKPQDKLTYQIFHWALEDEQRELEPDIAELSDLLPLNQFDGPQISFPRQIAWRTDNPWNRPRDYDNAIRRILNFTRWADGAIARMREGLRRGVVQPRAIVERVLGQIDSSLSRISDKASSWSR